MAEETMEGIIPGGCGSGSLDGSGRGRVIEGPWRKPPGVPSYDELAARCEDIYRRAIVYDHEIQQIAGKALGYPWFKDDQKNFPGATDQDGVCVGEHVGATIVQELANKYTALLEKVKRQESRITELEWEIKVKELGGEQG
jgi:hypothetical protein